MMQYYVFYVLIQTILIFAFSKIIQPDDGFVVLVKAFFIFCIIAPLITIVMAADVAIYLYREFKKTQL